MIAEAVGGKVTTLAVPADGIISEVAISFTSVSASATTSEVTISATTDVAGYVYCTLKAQVVATTETPAARIL